MNRKNRIILCVVAITIISIFLIGFTYGYYYTNIIGNSSEKSISVTLANLELTYDNGTGNIEAYNIVPGDVIVSKTFSVENTGTFDISNYVIYLDEVTNTFINKEDIVLTLTCTTSEGYKCNGTETAYPDNSKVLVVNDIKVGVTHNYNVQIEYIETYEDQSIDKNKTFTGNIVIKDIRETDSVVATATGTNSVSIESLSGIKNYRIYGNSIQDGTPTLETPIEVESVGDKTSNLFNPNATAGKIVSDAYYGVDLSGIESDFGVSVKLKDGKTAPQVTFGLVYIYSTGTSPSAIWFSRRGSSNLDKSFASKPSKEVSSIGLGVYPGTEDNWNAVLDAYDIYIVEGTYTESTMPDYEPYGYEIPITISGNNVIDTNVWISGTHDNGFNESSTNRIVEVGENYVEANLSAFTGIASEMLDVSVLNSIHFRVNQDCVIDDFINYYVILQFYTEDKSKLSNYILVKSGIADEEHFFEKGSSFYIPTNAKYFRLALVSRKALNKIRIYDLYINRTGTKEYKPYQEPIRQTIYLDEPLRCTDNSNLDNCDYIDFTSGRVVRKYNKLELSTSALQIDQSNDSDRRFALYLPTLNIPLGDLSYLQYSNYFILKKGNSQPHGYFYISSFLVIQDNDNYWPTLDDFKTFINEKHNSGKPIYFIYKLKTSSDKTIELPSLLKNSGTNIINVNTSIAPSSVVIDYYS